MAEDESSDKPRTLGDVLYRGSHSRPAPAEAEWLALVESIARGDQVALHALYARAHRLVFTLILRLTRSRETAEELTVDVFHDIWRRASTYQAANGTVLGWIMNQARSRAIDRIRFDTRKKRVDPGADDPLANGEAAAADTAVELKQQGRKLQAALAVLTAGERQAIEAVFFSDLTYVEVAERLSQPLGTIKTRIRSGLYKLRQRLAGAAE